MSKPRLIKPKKIGKLAGKSTFGGLFIEIENEGVGNTNKILHEFFIAADVFIDLTPEGKYYKGKDIKVWNLKPEYIKMLYKERHNFKLKFVVYAEINSTLQLYKLLEPVLQKKAKQAKLLKKSGLENRAEKRRGKSAVQETPN